MGRGGGPKDFAAEEPPSLRRLRESLSSLEQLERRRQEIRQNGDLTPCSLRCDAVLSHGGGQSFIGDVSEIQRVRPVGEGYRSSASSRPGSASPRWRSSSPRAHHRHHRSGAGAPGAAHGQLSDSIISPARSSHPRNGEGGSRPQPAAWGGNYAAESDATSLAMALERSQDRGAALHRDLMGAHRQEAELRRQLSDQDGEIRRLKVLLERWEGEAGRLAGLVEHSEAQQRMLTEEKQTALNDLQKARREHRDALEQIAALTADLHQSRLASEDCRSSFERLVSDQRHQIEVLEDTSRIATCDLEKYNHRASEFGEALFTCLYERTALLQFLVDLLTALQSLFYDPTPFVKASTLSGNVSSLSIPIQSQSITKARPRSASAERGCGPRQNGCSVCGSIPPVAPGGIALYQSGPRPPCRDIQARGAARNVNCMDWREGLQELRELIRSLEGEISEASNHFSTQAKRMIDEAEKSSQALGLQRCNDVSGSTLASLADRPTDWSAMRVSNAWVEQERERRIKQGVPTESLAPRVDWVEERAAYQATTKSMETKFAQLAKLKRVLGMREGVVRRKPTGR
eukprot:gnl/TRDRNA2_/TRDRNA2_183888_c0_seq1.p1 gnl/TRDRNA2_/TRDRNA2_183888_c0~~gnl/TRDRNA2_/TRDRNA2_183888_c0_seq1.p1  ORF type:complete len:603 (-),score=87.19 gnl/TRDRNA2_/TRDRNA2_183888_c0_seq1:64-1785(-)